MEYYAKVCFFIAAKFNEVRWPMVQDIILGYQEQVYLQKEHEILQAVNFKIPQSNHVFYLSILFEIFELNKKQQENSISDLFLLIKDKVFLLMNPKEISTMMVLKHIKNQTESLESKSFLIQNILGLTQGELLKLSFILEMFGN